MAISAEMLNFILAALLALVALVGWLLNNSFNGLANTKSIKILWTEKASEKDVDEMRDRLNKLEDRLEALDNRIIEKLSSIDRSLARIQGRLSIDEREDKT